MRKYFNKRISAFKAAFKGLKMLLIEEAHGRLHFLAAIVAIVVSLLLGVSKMELIIIVLLIALVFAAELINSALERIVDLVQPEYHELAGKAKDFAAAAVLVLSLAALIIGWYIWSDYIYLRR